MEGTTILQLIGIGSGGQAPKPSISETAIHAITGPRGLRRAASASFMAQPALALL
jgi:hypothetical protein